MTPLELNDFLEKFSGVRQSGEGWVAKCPIHGDAKASLSIGADSDKIKLYCHAGCPTETVLDCVGVKFSDLFFSPMPDAKKNGHRPMDEPEIIATYDYKDETGKVLYQVVRYEPKDFRQRKPDGAGWTWNTKDVQRVPYMLADLIDDPKADVFIVEGEKDVHALRSHGFVATTNAGGAKGLWDKEWNKYFIGRAVYLVPDRDKPGYERVNKIARLLEEVCLLYVIELEGFKDISDWFRRHRPDDLRPLTESAPRYTKPIHLNDGPKFPDIPLHGLMGEIVSLLTPHTEASSVALYVELLSMVGSCLNAGPHFKVNGTKHRGNLYCIICGETSKARKGTAHDTIKEFFRKVDLDFVRNCCRGGLASGEGLIAEVQDPVIKINKDGKETVTREGAIDTRKIFCEPEIGGRTLKVLRRDGNTLSPIMREAWESTELHVSTRQDRLTASNAHISIVGHSTVEELMLNLNRDDISNGFANRFMFFVVSHSDWKPEVTEPDEAEANRLAALLRAAVTQARTFGQIRWDEVAQKAWNKLYVNMMNADEGLGFHEAILGRGPAQIMRIAMIHAVIDGRREANIEDQLVATALWEYSVRSVQIIAGASETALMTPDARRVFEFLEEQIEDISFTQLKDGIKWQGTRLATAKAWLLKNRMIYEYRQQGNRGRPRTMIGVDR